MQLCNHVVKRFMGRISMTKEKKKMGRPIADTEPVMIRMTRDMIQALDDHRRVIEDLPTRPELIRRIVAQWLDQKGQDVRE